MTTHGVMPLVQCLEAMHFMFGERRFWERSSTHTFLAERDPDFQRFVSGRTGRVRTYIHIWVAEWDGAAQYLGGVWGRGNGLRRHALRRIARNLAVYAGRERARALLPRLGKQLARFQRESLAVSDGDGDGTGVDRVGITGASALRPTL